jgi:hypothetical protein
MIPFKIVFGLLPLVYALAEFDQLLKRMWRSLE